MNPTPESPERSAREQPGDRVREPAPGGPPPGSAAPGATEEARFRKAMAFLSSFTDYEQILLQAPARTTFDLGRLERLLERFGAPHRGPRPVIHVTGTKGKSSVVWICEALLRAHGLRTFRFISPHVEDVRERLAVDGRSIDAGAFADLVDLLEPEVRRIRRESPADLPSFFEAMTVMGFLCAERAGVGASVLEVGLGGRLDATNVVDPTVSVITGVALDHTRILGSTIEAIAGEKAGIIKKGRPVICGLAPGDPGFEVIQNRWLEVGGPRFAYPGAGMELESCALTRRADGRPGLEISGMAGPFRFRDFRLGLGGPRQGWNAVMALAAAAEVLASQGRALEEDAARSALGDLAIPGRAEFLAGAPPIILDGAHTAESVAALAEMIDALWPDRPLHVVCGMTRDRDPERVLAPLRSRALSLSCARLPSPRSHEPDELAVRLAAAGFAAAAARDEPFLALERAIAEAGGDGLVLVTGSLYLVGALRRGVARG